MYFGVTLARTSHFYKAFIIHEVHCPAQYDAPICFKTPALNMIPNAFERYGLEQPKHRGPFVSYCHRHRVARHPVKKMREGAAPIFHPVPP